MRPALAGYILEAPSPVRQTIVQILSIVLKLLRLIRLLYIRGLLQLTNRSFTV